MGSGACPWPGYWSSSICPCASGILHIMSLLSHSPTPSSLRRGPTERVTTSCLHWRLAQAWEDLWCLYEDLSLTVSPYSGSVRLFNIADISVPFLKQGCMWNSLFKQNEALKNHETWETWFSCHAEYKCLGTCLPPQIIFTFPLTSRLWWPQCFKCTN